MGEGLTGSRTSSRIGSGWEIEVEAYVVGRERLGFGVG